MKAYSGSVGAEVYLYALLTSAIDGGEESTLGPTNFIHKKRTPVATE
jgi:hypothetical protein